MFCVCWGAVNDMRYDTINYKSDDVGPLGILFYLLFHIYPLSVATV